MPVIITAVGNMTVVRICWPVALALAQAEFR